LIAEFPDSALESGNMLKKIFSGIGAFLQTPSGVIISTNAAWYIVVVFVLGITYDYPYSYLVNIFLLGVDVFVASYLLDRLNYFFAQFVLPIQNDAYRQEIYSRVKNFETGSRGPALFVKNGRVIMHEGETDKRGAGVIVLDTASALVLRTDTEIKDTVGPGVKFTKEDEYIAGSVDLRAQWQFIGPLRAEQPFLNPVPISSPKDYNETQARRQQTSGLTRDGFEISPTISIKFSIRRPVEKLVSESGVRSQYGFDAEAVRNAITREVVQLGTTDNSQVRMEWNRLPAHLVVNIWREYIRKFKLGDLFTSSKTSGLQTIEDMINDRVKKANVEGLDDTGARTGEWVESLEFKQLQSRGLEIREVRIHNVLFEPSIEEQIIQQWSAEWMKIAKKEENYLKEMEALIETAARDEGSKSFARIASKQFSGKPTMPQQNPFKTLQLLIHPLKEFILNESSANSDMEKELRKLDDIWKWLLDHSSDGGAIPPAPQGGYKP
jgi:hypothetical protein